MVFLAMQYIMMNKVSSPDAIAPTSLTARHFQKRCTRRYRSDSTFFERASHLYNARSPDAIAPTSPSARRFQR